MCCWSLEESFHFLASVAFLCYKGISIAFAVDAEALPSFSAYHWDWKHLQLLHYWRCELLCCCYDDGVILQCLSLSDWHAGVRVCTTVALSASLDQAKLNSISVSARKSTSKSKTNFCLQCLSVFFWNWLNCSVAFALTAEASDMVCSLPGRLWSRRLADCLLLQLLLFRPILSQFTKTSTLDFL